MRLVRADITAAWLSSLNKENDPTPTWSSVSPLISIFYAVLRGSISFLLSVWPPSLTTAPPLLPPPLPLPSPQLPATPTPCMFGSHTYGHVCAERCYIMPSFHCTPDQREQSSREKLLLAGFSSLPPSHCFISTQRLYSRLHYYLLQDSSLCWKTKQSEWWMIRGFTVKKREAN